MKDRRISLTLTAVLITTALIFTPPVYSEENIQELKNQIKALQERVSELEGQKQRPQRRYYVPRRRSVFDKSFFEWDPFKEMTRMHEDVDRLFQDSFEAPEGNYGMYSTSFTFNSGLDIKEKDDEYEISFDMTGWDKDKLDIQVKGQSLTIKGEHRKEDKKEDPSSFFHTQSYGSFMKTIPIPEDADSSKMQIDKNDDSLVVKFPKVKK